MNALATEPQERPPYRLEPKEMGEDFEGKTNPAGLIFLAGLFGLLWFAAGPRYFWVVVGLVVMIFLHELGHYLTARWSGMKVTQFFLFMGPRLWSFRKGETEYGIRLLPVGAFVRVVGMNNLDPPAPEEADRAYMNKSYPRQMFMITAGSMMHFIQAILLFTLVTSVYGLYDADKWAIDVIPEAKGEVIPSIEAGLAPGDDIVAIDGQDTTNWYDLVAYVEARPGEEVTLSVVSGGEQVEKTVTLGERPSLDPDAEDETRGYLGVGPKFEVTKSASAGVKEFGNTMWVAVSSIPQFFAPSTLADLATLPFKGSEDVDIRSDEAKRPISLVGAVRFAGQAGDDAAGPLMMLGMFNVFIGVLNLAPLLPLDGGHAVVATYERLRSRKGQERYRADMNKLLPVTYVVIAFLLFIGVTTMFLDIVRPISG